MYYVIWKFKGAYASDNWLAGTYLMNLGIEYRIVNKRARAARKMAKNLEANISKAFRTETNASLSFKKYTTEMYNNIMGTINNVIESIDDTKFIWTNKTP